MERHTDLGFSFGVPAAKDTTLRLPFFTPLFYFFLHDLKCNATFNTL
jgi:hypothetical protein